MDFIFGEEIVSDNEEETPAVSGLQMSLEHRQFRFHKAQPLQEHQQSQLYRAPSLHQHYKPFNIRRPDQRTSECKHLSRTRIPTKKAADGKNGRTKFSLVSDISASQILRITSLLFTFTGEKKMRELIESLESVPTPSSAELSNEYEKIIANLKNHFISMVNPDCARSKLKKCVNKNVNQWVSITCAYSFKFAKCGFTDANDVIRSKIQYSKQYSAGFIPNFGEMTTPMRDLATSPIR